MMGLADGCLALEAVLGRRMPSCRSVPPALLHRLKNRAVLSGMLLPTGSGSLEVMILMVGSLVFETWNLCSVNDVEPRREVPRM